MRKILLPALLVGICLMASGQAKKPTLMVVPSDSWMEKNGYMTPFDNQGKIVLIPDYKAAVRNSDLLMVIGKINELMAERGFPLKDLESALKTLESESAEDAMLTSKSGGDIAENPIDKLKKVAKADVWMQISWTINEMGPLRSVDFTFRGLDAYTDKQIAGASGTGQRTMTPELAILLVGAVLSHLDNFNSQLQAHFDDMFANGRETVLRIKVFSDWDYDLETEEFGDDELGSIIEGWISKNTVQGRFNTSDATENMMLFEQVRIPLFDETGRATDARRWCNGLRKFLKDTYEIESKLMMKGLGQAQLVLGEK